jgi:ABC-2 type transport system permease protein
MHKIWAIAAREYLASVRTKAFLISLILMPVLMGGGVVAHMLLEGRVDLEDKRLVVVDATGRVFETLRRAADERNAKEIRNERDGRQVDSKILVEAGPPAPLDDQQRLALSDRIRKRQIHGFVEIDADVFQARKPGEKRQQESVRFYSESAGSRVLNRWFARALGTAVQGLRLRDAGLDPELVARATAPVDVDTLGLYSRTSAGAIKSGDQGSRVAAFFLPIAIMMLMFLSLMLSQTMMTSTLEEKQQKIAEVLLGSARPFELMLGKLLGNTGVSLTTVAIYMLGGLGLLHRFGQGDVLRGELVAWFLLFQALGVVMFGSVFVAVGAAVNDIKEAQNLILPVMLVLVMPMMIWLRLVEEPMSRFATGMSLVPMWTPMLMPMRMAATAAVPWWQPVVGAFGTLVAVVACAWAAGRIFRVGMLLTGKPPKISDLARWVIRG